MSPGFPPAGSGGWGFPVAAAAAAGGFTPGHYGDPDYAGGAPEVVPADGGSHTLYYSPLTTNPTWIDGTNQIALPGIYSHFLGISIWTVYAGTGLFARITTSMTNQALNFSLDELIGAGDIYFELEVMSFDGIDHGAGSDLPFPPYVVLYSPNDMTGSLSVVQDAYRLGYA